jgi:hypothetical protein
MNHQFDYNSILFLNNCAITMMERCCYEQAYATLRNAADVSKILIHCHDPKLSSELINDKLNQSLQRLSNPARSNTTLPLNVVTHNQDGPTCTLPNTSNRPAVVIRIDDTDHFDLLDDHEVPRLLMAIVFYNNAVVSTHYLDNDPEYHADKYLALGFRLACQVYEDAKDSRDPFLMQRACAVALIVLQMFPKGQNTGYALAHFRSVACKFDHAIYSTNTSASPVA